MGILRLTGKLGLDTSHLVTSSQGLGITYTANVSNIHADFVADFPGAMMKKRIFHSVPTVQRHTSNLDGNPMPRSAVSTARLGNDAEPRLT
jgi:hypothetical protein